MAKTERILLIDKQRTGSFELELILRIGGYQVETCTDVNTAINRFGLYRSTESGFDMVVAATDNHDREVLEKLYQERYIDHLLLFNRQLACPELFCIYGQLAYLCDSTALLACVDKLKTGLSTTSAPELRQVAT